MNVTGGRILVLVGALMLALGVFLPLVQIPLRGPFDLFDFPIPGIGALALAGAALLLAALDLSRHALWPALGSLAMVGYGYVRVQGKIEEYRQGLKEFDIHHPLSIIRGAAATAAKLDYGWAVLGLGALMTIAGSVMAWRGMPRGASAVRTEEEDRSEFRSQLRDMAMTQGRDAPVSETRTSPADEPPGEA